MATHQSFKLLRGVAGASLRRPGLAAAEAAIRLSRVDLVFFALLGKRTLSVFLHYRRLERLDCSDISRGGHLRNFSAMWLT